MLCIPVNLFWTSTGLWTASYWASSRRPAKLVTTSQQLVQRQHCSQIINLKTMSVPVNAFFFFASALLRESKRVGTAARCEFHSLPINVLTNPITYNWLRSNRDKFNGRRWNWSLWPVRGLFWESWIIGWISDGLYCFLVKNLINPSFSERV